MAMAVCCLHVYLQTSYMAYFYHLLSVIKVKVYTNNTKNVQDQKYEQAKYSKVNRQQKYLKKVRKREIKELLNYIALFYNSLPNKTFSKLLAGV